MTKVSASKVLDAVDNPFDPLSRIRITLPAEMGAELVLNLQLDGSANEQILRLHRRKSSNIT